ncbi:hypothetical protein P6F26_08235 [Roseibacterium sp. SDUM158017]|uniref:hypothetical protein n=1 Tax=Roseicyclus salinarum TaxID=3036773 RepID=UPI0024155D0F|nr:hypothetical protein [Roseibacterium sp. SDUM158017]MDG4648431.1 hypothetical protein [Roseibacterium sp. SDUM158017]
MKQIGHLIEADGRYEFRHHDMALVVRGDHPEWVLQAAAEVMSQTCRLELESRIDELSSLVEFEEASDLDVDSARFQHSTRFETIPQCVVTMGKLDYRWAAPEGREIMGARFDGHTVARVQDMSLTYNDSFLKNVDGVDTSEQ